MPDESPAAPRPGFLRQLLGRGRRPRKPRVSTADLYARARGPGPGPAEVLTPAGWQPFPGTRNPFEFLREAGPW